MNETEARKLYDQIEVPCYALVDVLRASKHPGHELAIAELQPHLRPTFTETWDSIGDSMWNLTKSLMTVLRALSHTPEGCGLGWDDQGRRVEKRLYQLAIECELTIVLGPPRAK